MKLLYSVKFECKRKANILVKDDTMVVCGITFSYKHVQDCCEHVYADFESMLYHEKQLDGSYIGINIYDCEGMGFIIGLNDEYVEHKVLINCYNEQNGYYSDDLNLIVSNGMNITEFSISKQDKIC